MFPDVKDIIVSVLSIEELSGIFVRSISEGSAAALDGRIQVNDQIIEVRSTTVFFTCMTAS